MGFASDFGWATGNRAVQWSTLIADSCALDSRYLTMARLVLKPTLIDRLNLEGALDDELRAGPRLLPTPQLDIAVTHHKKTFLKHVQSRIVSGIDIAVPEVILAKKAQRGVRPVPALPLVVRVLYRAMVNSLSELLPPLDRTNAASRAFRAAPLKDKTVKFVAMGDIAACYQYLDHELIEWELINQTGEAELSGDLRRLAGLIAGRAFGLPQNHNPSHALADVVLDIIERRLVRKGHKVWRFNDDYRIGAATWREASLALEDLEAESNKLGLTLNDEKAGIKHRQGYQQLMEGAEARWKQIQTTVASELIEYNPYTDEVAAPRDEEVTAGAAITVLEAWRENVDAGANFYGYEAIQERQLVQNAVFSLQVVKDSRGIDFIPLVLKQEPSLTPFISNYLGSRAEDDSAAVTEAIDSVLKDDDVSISDWQALWLLEALRSGDECSPGQTSWAQELIRKDPSQLVAARAALMLAKFDEIDTNAIVQVYSQQHEASKPDAVAALALRVLPSKSDTLLDAVVADAPEFQFVVKMMMG